MIFHVIHNGDIIVIYPYATSPRELRGNRERERKERVCVLERNVTLLCFGKALNASQTNLRTSNSLKYNLGMEDMYKNDAKSKKYLLQFSI